MKPAPARRWMRALAACLLAVTAGCDDGPQQPAPVAHASLDLVVEPTSAGFDITATVTNDGDVAVNCWVCTCYLAYISGPYLGLVFTSEPLTCTDACGILQLAPGEVWRESHSFTGVVYTYQTPRPEPALPGTYAVRTSVSWFVDDENARQFEQRRETFDWPPR